MKRIIASLILCLFGLIANANETNETRKVSIRAILSDEIEIPQEATTHLANKLQRIISSYGLADNGLTDRFIFTAKVNVLQKDIVATTPARVSLKLEISFYVGDIIENKVFSSYALEVSGIGINENKAYIDAIKGISVSDKSIKNFIETGKIRIVEYYNSHCNSIIADADRMAQQGLYEEAIAELVSVPNLCEDCYRQTREKAVAINDEYMNIEGERLIKQANAEWVIKQDYKCAEKALSILSQINPLARCSKDADELIVKIDNKLRDEEAKIEEERIAIDKRNWEFKMQQYQDNIKITRERETNNTMLLSKLIDVAENVGCVFGKNLPKIIKNSNRIKKW